MSRLHIINDYLVPMVCCSSKNIISEVAGGLSEGHDFAGCYFDKGTGTVEYSLRSRENGIDVSEIAGLFGGGGHKHAAGFNIKVEDINYDSTKRIRAIYSSGK